LRTDTLFRSTLVVTIASVLFVAQTKSAPAIPIFAQRYHFQCNQCHTVIPELNAFGRAFRAGGYQLPIAKHGTTVAAIRFQEQYLATPSLGSAHFTPGWIVLGNEDFGRIAAFVHYSLGSQGGPGGLFLGYLATYDEHSKTLFRGGLFELPLAQSPGQRLDDLQAYGYYGAHVGLNDLPLSSPRWGTEIEQDVGVARIGATIDFGEFKGAPYGGKPVPTGETTSAETPELGLWLRSPLIGPIDIGATALTGTRRIVLTGNKAFDDGYNRYGLLGHAELGHFDVQAEQWWGRDANSDGFGTVVGSSGGYGRVKYYPTPHMYVAIRYDSQATPIITRDVVYYAAYQLFGRVRLLFQEVHPVGGINQFGGAVTVGFPWPLKL
jgi:hypothetical protein